MSLDKVYVILVLLLSLPLGARPLGEEVIFVSVIISFTLSVAAGVVSYYLCTWLDEQFFNKGSKH